jgi:predicted transcriptional regulator
VNEFDLGDAEFEVLKVLWTLKQGSVRDVLAALHARGRNVAYTTVQTMLTRLEQKGVVGSDRSGAAFVYKPRVSQRRFRQARVKTVRRGGRSARTATAPDATLEAG